jgi:hypothetical protein
MVPAPPCNRASKADSCSAAVRNVRRSRACAGEDDFEWGDSLDRRFSSAGFRLAFPVVSFSFPLFNRPICALVLLLN